MQVQETLYRIPAKEVNFKNMPNDEEFYFVIDLADGKRVHRCGHIKANPGNFKYVLLDRTQLTEQQVLLALEQQVSELSDKLSTAGHLKQKAQHQGQLTKK